jgi:tetratricopeptide (TPR) repeat protein
LANSTSWWMMLGIKSSVLMLALVLQSDLFLQGLAQFRKGDYRAAETSLVKALKSHDDPRARAFLALSRAAIGECEQAMPELKSQFAAKENSDVRRLSGLAAAQCEMSARHFGPAIGLLEQLKRAYPSDPDVLYDVARLHMMAWDQAVHEMFEKTPASFRVNQLSGEIFEVQNKYAEAANEYRKAIAKNPDALSLHFRLGRALLMSSHKPEILSQARQQFEAELALNPSDAAAEYEIALILLTQQKSREAVPHLERAVQLNSEFPEALIALGEAKIRVNANSEAIPLLERATRFSPRSESAHYNLMIAYRNTGRTQDALRQKAELDKLQRPPEGEFSDFLHRLGEKTPVQ